MLDTCAGWWYCRERNGVNQRESTLTNVDWVSRVGDALKHLDEEFVENELAYLALTSKVEKPIVDRLAFRLHRDYGDDRVAVAREFTVRKEIQRVDLAVVVEKTPHLLLEAKAMNGLKEDLLPEKPEISNTRR